MSSLLAELVLVLAFAGVCDVLGFELEPFLGGGFASRFLACKLLARDASLFISGYNFAAIFVI